MIHNNQQPGSKTEAAAAYFGRELKRLILADADPSVIRCIAHQVPAPVSAGQAVQVARYNIDAKGLPYADPEGVWVPYVAAPVSPPDGAMPEQIKPWKDRLFSERKGFSDVNEEGLRLAGIPYMLQEIAELRAAQPAEGSAQVTLTYTVDGVVMSPLEYIDHLHTQLAAPERSDTPAPEEIRNAAFEQAASLCDRFGKREMHPAECAGAIRMMKSRIDGDKQGAQGDKP